jgi:hypothetical protein
LIIVLTSLCLCGQIVPLAVRKPLVQHEVYEHSGDAHVHPQRPRPARDGAMAVIAAAQPAAQCNDDHWHDDDGQGDVRNQHDQVNDVPEVTAQEPDVADVGVKIHVAGQKQSRGDDRGNHARSMRGNFTPHNQAAANEQQHRAGSIQTGDEGREVGVLFSDHIFGNQVFRNQAAGLVVRRFAIRNASPNITSENRSNVAIADGNGKVVSIPG